jgi:hypothetical protein
MVPTGNYRSVQYVYICNNRCAHSIYSYRNLIIRDILDVMITNIWRKILLVSHSLYHQCRDVGHKTLQ